MVTVKLAPKFLKEELGLPHNPNIKLGVLVIKNSLSAIDENCKFFDLIFEYDSKAYATHYYTTDTLGPWEMFDQQDDLIECIQVIEEEVMMKVWVPI